MLSQVNLLPKEYRPKPAVRIWPVLLALTFILSVVGMGSWWFFLQLDLAASHTNLQLKTNEVQKLQAEVEVAEAAALLEAEVIAKREFISNTILTSVYWNPMLEALERAMVPGVTIKSLTGSESGTVSVSGETDTVKSVADFLGSLQVETGLQVIRVSSVQPEGSFQVRMDGWSGREVAEDE